MTQPTKIVCAVCGLEMTTPGEWRGVRLVPSSIDDTVALRITDRFANLYEAVRDIRYSGPAAVTVCGQQHALILTERYLERGSFEPSPALAQHREAIYT